MILRALAIHDKKAELFSMPIFVQAVGQGVRSFADTVNDGKSEYARHPEDYTLFDIGSYDDVKGQLVSIVPVSLGNGVTFVTGDPRQLALLKDA